MTTPYRRKEIIQLRAEGRVAAESGMLKKDCQHTMHDRQHWEDGYDDAIAEIEMRLEELEGTQK